MKLGTQTVLIGFCKADMAFMANNGIEGILCLSWCNS